MSWVLFSAGTRATLQTEMEPCTPRRRFSDSVNFWKMEMLLRPRDLGCLNMDTYIGRDEKREREGDVKRNITTEKKRDIKKDRHTKRETWHERCTETERIHRHDGEKELTSRA